MSNHFKDFSAYFPTRSGCTDIYKEVLNHLNVIREKYSDNGILRGVNADLGSSGGTVQTAAMVEKLKISRGQTTKLQLTFLVVSINSHVISWHDIIKA